MSEQIVGVAQMQHPLVRRLLAGNPGPFTYSGTQTYLVGTRDVAVVDPGPDLPGHVDAILAAIGDAPLKAIVCTHTHRDHSPAAVELKARTGAPIIGCAPLVLDDSGPRADAAFDRTYVPDEAMADEARIEGDGWTLEAVHTPGHTSNHICYALPEAQVLFTGDHVMGWSTSVISPPDGNMGDYLASLDRLMAREQDSLYFSAHGDPIERPHRFVRGLIGHRKQREGQILRLLEKDVAAIPEMVKQMYSGVDPRLHGAAGLSVLAHLIDLQMRGIVRNDDDLWSLAA
ncbi:MBL fold metallo-hydrolase [Rhizorhabdus dicambivorans]|uniref:MBL fold metallo-hydrolase n=1 Tax=Rhizorhabdus dicambivorans TaxID=1850238 RepID=A0A2A4FZ20_9SPHN|nr:MBL fold metallo-hydrolase [Rhizorhabdus dicambivorans]ATE65882.1 MBL fold metallo-hydrolase [Rhizorhabdus dicambivorans]PCE42996.1 MBL fold metallo-hydrolase [Rhizorhabdus dicambivorans]